MEIAKNTDKSTLIPLTGASLWACTQLSGRITDGFLFPRYSNKSKCNSNTASNALNRWLKTFLPRGYVVHGFRHAMRDRLRAVECPVDMVDQIGGWSNQTIGQRYGSGYPLANLKEWMDKIVIDV